MKNLNLDILLVLENIDNLHNLSSHIAKHATELKEAHGETFLKHLEATMLDTIDALEELEYRLECPTDDEDEVA